MKWFTCTPVRFTGGAGFFARDSGLLSRGFSMIGMESKAIMPGPSMDQDDPSLIRTDYKNLEDSSWWSSHKLDGVVLYAWGMPRYAPIAAAIRKAGIFLISNMDTSGLISPYLDSISYLKRLVKGKIAMKGFIRGMLSSSLSLPYAAVPSVDRMRIKHLEHADIISTVTPYAARLLSHYLRRYGCEELTRKVIYMPHPQLPVFQYDDSEKENIILCVARWNPSDWPSKNPKMILKSLGYFLKERPEYKGVIVGSDARSLIPMAKNLCDVGSGQLELKEFIPIEELPTMYNKSKIAFWASPSEGQQGTGAQALCCGCSVVSTGGVSLNCFHHYADRESGRVALRNTSRHLADALHLEADAWEQGHRDARRISSSWVDEFHVDKIALKFSKLLTQSELAGQVEG